MRVLSKWARWLELRQRLARWIDPLDWDALVKPKSRAEVAESELGLWLTAAEYEGLEGAVAEDPIDLTPEQQARADAAREELLAVISGHRAQRLRRVRARRLRRAALVVSGSLLGLAALAGTTGVGPLDSWHGTGDQGQERTTGRPFEDSLRSYGPIGLEPKLASATKPLTLPWKAGLTAEARAYVSASHGICTSIARTVQSSLSSPRNRGCGPVADLWAQLSHRPAVLSGILSAEVVVVKGFTTSDVKAIDVTGPYGAMRVWMTGIWEPDVPDTRPIRFFVAMADRPIGRKHDLRESNLALNLRHYQAQVQLRNGQIVPIENPWAVGR